MNPDGSMFRAKRVALGFGVWELGLSPREALYLLKLEEGTREGSFDRFQSLIDDRLEELVRFCKSEGFNPLSLRINPWSAREILYAARHP